jgi:hypothetical protein
MTDHAWDEIEAFASPDEFRRFEEWMRSQVDAGQAEEIGVEMPYYGVTSLRERWFRHCESCEIWRLVDPDPPYYGEFCRVK